MTRPLPFLLACLTCALAGCAGSAKVMVAEVPQVFPAPPDEPRVIFERTLYGSGDLVKERQSSLLTFLTGTKNGPGEVEGMARPQALAVHRGRVFVANAQDRPVSVFDLPRNRFYRIGEEGFAGALQMPAGLSVDRTGNLFVADSAKNAILVYDAEGKYLHRIGGPEWFSHLTNVTAERQGDRVYAIDVGDTGHRVRVFDARDGHHLFDFGARGHGPGEFNIPFDLAVGKDGRLNVVDSGNFRVLIFDHDGKFLKSFGSAGKKSGQFTRPKEIATDADGNLYVVDGTFGNFQVFDPDGAFLYFVGSHGDDGGNAKYMLPTGIDIDDDGRIYVVDQWYGKIDIFRSLRKSMEQR